MSRYDKRIQKVKIGIACVLIPFLGSPMLTVLLHIISTHACSLSLYLSEVTCFLILVPQSTSQFLCF